ncbi:bifunctional aminoglycoside phosphotransferase/ATP-binding protein [Ensifer sp. SL37]|uniref:bifunctional aminoglycoside phosphotransferase/ATP-binding protein n=1 Tax=Ensifer sp. SL37 TaxID=2995137 RepID=UPI0022747438|nr:bifunctional aminoglycoside phosphotransferase/ATP-binding protein [Ensifer sp. SL37]MCY1746300.1 AAA family ATPase [Ensifer sp. SL37]
MLVQDQTDVIAFLGDRHTYGSDSVEHIETHISHVFLARDRAFKMKRAVKLPYVDFSTPELRLRACQREVERNGATAPGLYLGVRTITRDQTGRLHFGDGDLVEPVVEMVRFDQDALFDRMAVGRRLDERLLTQAARMIARYHHVAPVVHHLSGSANISAVLAINRAGFGTSRVFDETEVTTIARLFEDALRENGTMLDRREASGKVKLCHGDLHLRNICLFGEQPRLFDCIEFNDQIATVDTLYDLAFLLMDLWHRGFPQFANLVMNRYLDDSDDEDGFVLLPFFMAIRAAVRAHVIATQAAEDANATQLVLEARSYFTLAHSLLTKVPPRLIVIGGFSGSGKTTVADALAGRLGAPPGARIIESDRIRKALYGVPPEVRLDADAYRADVSDKVYCEIARRTVEIAKAGGSVVADAVFDRSDKRKLMEVAAKVTGVPCVAVWLEAGVQVLRHRVASRHEGPSDADLHVLARQISGGQKPLAWRVIDAEQPVDEIVREILEPEKVTQAEETGRGPPQPDLR